MPSTLLMRLSSFSLLSTQDCAISMAFMLVSYRLALISDLWRSRVSSGKQIEMFVSVIGHARRFVLQLPEEVRDQEKKGNQRKPDPLAVSLAQFARCSITFLFITAIA